AELGAMLETASLGRLAPPVVRDAAIVLGCTRDGFVSRAETEALARHWSAELRWIPGGHVSGLALGARAMRRATLDALGRLPAPQWAFANT
ncbi:MAG: alpha/beta hydrolase family protein, partial [Polyangiaceae bacterium]